MSTGMLCRCEMCKQFVKRSDLLPFGGGCRLCKPMAFQETDQESLEGGHSANS